MSNNETLKKSLTAIVIRHGATAANRDGMVQGQDDSPLTQEGEAATRRKAGKLSAFSFDTVYCSDLGRARKTYEILKSIAPSIPEAEYRPELREIDFGELTGRRKEEIMPAVLYHKANTAMRYPGGESGDNLKERVLEFFSGLYLRHEGGVVLAVTHYGVMETLARHVAGVRADAPVVIGEEDVWRLRFYAPTQASLETL